MSWGDEGGLFVAVTVDLKEVFGRKGCVIESKVNSYLSAYEK